MTEAVPTADAAPPPRSPTSGASQLWRALKIFIAIVYLLIATVVSVLGSALVPRIGPPLSCHFPANSALAVQLKSGDATWAAMEAHPGVQALWASREFQRRTELHLKWERALDRWQSKGGDRFFHLDRPGLAFALGGELGLAVQPKPPGEKDDGEAPTVLFARVQGARGGLLRLLLWISAHFDRNPNRKELPRLLGGDLVAMEVNGGAAAEMGTGLQRPVAPPAAVGFIHIQRALLQVVPSLWTLLEVNAPEKIQLFVEPFGQGGLCLSGQWDGALPPPEVPAALPAPELAEGAKPMLDLTAPLNARDAFLRWVEGETSKGGKKEFRWQMRMGRLADAGVDLNRDLWPYCGHTVRLQVLPPPEASAAENAVVAFSLPFKESIPSTATPMDALLAFGRAYADECYEGSAPRDAERPYFVHIKEGDVSRMVWVPSTILRPTFYVHPRGFGVLSDAGAMATTPVAPRLGEPEARPEDVFHLKADGEQLAPQLAGLKRRQLEDLRDDLGAAEFLRQVPDENAVVGFVEKLSKAIGHLEIAICCNPASGRPATVRLEWEPKLE